MDNKGGNTMNRELIALVDGEMGEGKKGGMMMGPVLSAHLTRVTFVTKLNRKPSKHYVHPHIGAREDGSMQMGDSKVWFELILSVDISRDVVIDVDEEE
jgi:hypothetical protein